MRRLRCFVVIGALAVAVGAVAVGPAAAAKGGNNDTAKQCQKGGWTTLASQTGAPFKNQGDCVNDGAQGLGVSPGPVDPQTVCLSVLGRPVFIPGQDGGLWSCDYQSPPGPAQSTALGRACALAGGSLTTQVIAGEAMADCSAD